MSGKTSYLVCGDLLEDGRAVTEGKKHQEALKQGPDKCVILRGEKEFYGLVKMLDDEAKAKNPKVEEEPAAKKEEAAASPVAAPAAAAATPAVKTESASKPVNPYAARNPCEYGPLDCRVVSRCILVFLVHSFFSYVLTFLLLHRAPCPVDAKPAGGATPPNPYAKPANPCKFGVNAYDSDTIPACGLSHFILD